MFEENEPLKAGVDKVRASPDGHFYHHPWVARVALELLPLTCRVHRCRSRCFRTKGSRFASITKSLVSNLSR